MNRHTQSLLRALPIVLICNTGSNAQESGTQMRTYVSGLGTDRSGCTASSPCRTLQAAIARTKSGGEVFVLDSADYGPVTIKKAITLSSEGAFAGILATSGTAITIEAGTSDVISLRGFDIDGGNTGGIGIHFKSGASLSVHKSVVRGFANTGVNFSANTASSLYVSDTNLSGNKSIGLLVSSSGAILVKGALHRVTASANGVGIAVNGSGVTLAISDLVASHNTYGIGANTSTVAIRNAMVSNNQVGVSAEQNSTIRVGQSTITGNTSGLQTSNGGQVQSYGNNVVSGNTSDGVPTSTLALQ